MAIVIWNVTHTFDPAARVENGPQFLVPDLEFKFNDSGNRKGVHHTVTADEGETRVEVERRGRAMIQGGIDAIRYLQVGRFNWWTEAASSAGQGLLTFTVRATATLGPRAIDFPTVGWRSDIPTEVRAWIVLAAQGQESQIPSVRLRVYFLVLEDLESRNKLDAVATVEYPVLAAVRHSVSHPHIKKPLTMKLLGEHALELASPSGTFSYDPTNPVHEDVILRFSDSAKAIVDKVLLSELGIRPNYWGC